MLIVLGTHAFAEEVADLAEAAGVEVAAFVENQDRSRCGRDLLGRPVVWIDDVPALAADHEAVCALGTTRRKGFCEQAAAAGLRFGTLVHPSAVVAPSAVLGPGTIVSAGVIVAAHTTIGSHVILNRGVLVGHHTSVGDHTTISPAANVAGRITIGTQAYIGMGAIVLNDLTVGDGALIGAGSLVTADVGAATQAMGSPARVVRTGIDPY